MTTTKTEKSAAKWVEKVVSESGAKYARRLLTYNVTKNPYFRESNLWITAAWDKLNELNPSYYPPPPQRGGYCKQLKQSQMNKYFIILLIIGASCFSLAIPPMINYYFPPKDKCIHGQEIPPFSRVDKYSEGLFEAEYEVELVSQDICIVRNVNTDEQWEVKPTEIDQFFMYDNQ